ncbi:OpgC family protein [Acuticoccus sediminis]|nr:OpgC domain-containing protein [Acuticoccus sediminis]
MSTHQRARRPRDLRLDFFRGLAMFIIFIAHVPHNPWKAWIPAAFGPSDATELFVFCSGMASAMAFGSLFRDRSFFLGTARTAYRVWQVYWAHVCLFAVMVTMIAIFDQMHGDDFYSTRLYTRPIFDDTARHLIGFMTLQYVPNYFDILPMYMVILMMMPVVMALSRISRWAVFAFIGGVWFLTQFDILQLGAEVREGNDREWFFNPFGWQIIFFLGFSFVMGWIKPPPRSWWLVLAAAVIVGLGVLTASRYGWGNFDWVIPFRRANRWLFWKTDLGIFRIVHFLAVCYLAWFVVGEGGKRLAMSGIPGRIVDVIRKVGQQSLAVFVSGMVLSQFMGAALDQTAERGPVALAWANLTGCAILIGIAYLVGWYKSEPWRREVVVPAKRVAEPRAEPRSEARGGEATSAEVRTLEPRTKGRAAV